MFDEQSFINGQVSESFSTRRLPIPVGTYTGVITEAKARTNVQGKKDPTKSWNFLDYVVELALTPEAMMMMETEQVTTKRNYSIMIELDPSGTSLASGKGKNVDLGRFRASINQNEDGKPWSPSKPVGLTVKVVVTHRSDDAGNPVDQIEMISL